MVNFVFTSLGLIFIFISLPVVLAVSGSEFNSTNFKIVKKNRNNYLIAILTLFLLIAPMASANIFSDVWGKITGKATSGTTGVNITVGNSAPTIPFVEAISATDPTIGTTKSITFNYTATDSDGYANIDNDTADAYFQRSGESTRSNTSCVARNASTNSITFTCTIDMLYFDQNGAWTINATIKDINSAYAENSSTTFTYNLLTAMVMSPTALTWATIGLTDTDVGSDNDPITINNSGNDVSLTVNTTAFNLRGETTTTQFIFSNNFTIDNSSQGCSGQTMANASSRNITNALLQRGNNSLNYNNDTSGQEQVFFCLKGVPQDISAQSYSSAAYGAWTVEVIT